MLELMAVETDNALVIIHAMPIRRRYRDYLTADEPKGDQMPSHKTLGHLADGTPLNDRLPTGSPTRLSRVMTCHRARVGRPSLDGRSGASPRVNFRMSARCTPMDRARPSKTVSQLAREALEDYVKER